MEYLFPCKIISRLKLVKFRRMFKSSSKQESLKNRRLNKDRTEYRERPRLNMLRQSYHHEWRCIRRWKSRRSSYRRVTPSMHSILSSQRLILKFRISTPNLECLCNHLIKRDSKREERKSSLLIFTNLKRISICVII